MAKFDFCVNKLVNMFLFLTVFKTLAGSSVTIHLTRSTLDETLNDFSILKINASLFFFSFF